MAIWLDRLATDRLNRASVTPADQPIALYAKSGAAFTLTAVNLRAEGLGFYAGMALADARAIYPALDVREADPEADAALLDQIAAWCERFTPIVVLDPPDGLFLDITGCAHLFGGEAALMADAKARLQGLSLRCAVAPTPGAAWALAHYRGVEIVPESKLHEALAPLPIEALRLAPDAAALLKRLGLKAIGQIENAPRAAFTARAGQNAMLRLDQAFGRESEALSPRRPPPPLYAARTLLEPITTLDALIVAAGDLCADLCAKLDIKGAGARRLLLSAFGVDGKTGRLELKLSRPERAPHIILRLFKERLQREAERFHAEFGFDTVRLDVCEIAPWVLRAAALAPVDALHDAEAEARLVDCIAARLGAGRVGKLGVRDTHAPERATDWNAQFSLTTAPPADGVMRRPLTLFPRAQPIEAMAELPDGPPAQFRWRRVMRRIVRAEGPERIAPHWLRAPHGRLRDYYRVEDAQGRRYWLYREGAYGEALPPRWFLHGLFA